MTNISPYVYPILDLDKILNLKVLYIINTICKSYNVTFSQMRNDEQNRDIIEPRYVCIYLIIKTIKGQGVTQKSIMDLFNRNLSNLSHVRKTVENRMETEKQFNKTILTLSEKLNVNI